MLSLFKEKLHIVQEGLTASLKGPAVGETRRTDLDAAASLLATYQRHWEQLRGLSEANAAQARVVDCQIELCHDRTKQVRFAIRKFNSNANDLSKIIVQTEKAVNGIGNIRSLIETVETGLLELEDLLEEEAQAARMENSRQRLLQFRRDRLISLDALRERLAEDYEEKQREVEEKKEVVKKKNFQEADKQFQEELHAYKQTGQLPKKDPVEGGLSIEEVELEQDMESLQEYLQN